MDKTATLPHRCQARLAVAHSDGAHDGPLARLTNGRLLINIVTGGDAIENRGDGVFLDHDERYEVTREFLNVYGDLLKGEPVTIEDGRILYPLAQDPRPAFYFGGSSEAGIDIAVDTVDKYLTWGQPPDLVAERSAGSANSLRTAAAPSTSASGCTSS